jgi:hypothetical protein
VQTHTLCEESGKQFQLKNETSRVLAGVPPIDDAVARALTNKPSFVDSLRDLGAIMNQYYQ